MANKNIFSFLRKRRYSKSNLALFGILLLFVAVFVGMMIVSEIANLFENPNCNWNQGEFCERFCPEGGYYFENGTCIQWAGGACCGEPPFSTIEECRNSCG